MTRSKSRINPRTRARRRMLVLCGILLLTAVTFPLWSKLLVEVFASEVLAGNDWFRIECVRVSGTRVVPPDSVLALANIKEGTPIFDLPLNVVERNIRRHPWIAQAYAQRRLPNRIEITVVEREPVAAVRDKSFFIVTSDSLTLIPPSEKWIWDLPILTPPRSVNFKAGERITDRATLNLLREVLIAYQSQNDLRESLSEMYYRNGEIPRRLVESAGGVESRTRSQ